MIAELAATLLASSSAIGQAPPALVIAVTLIVLGVYALGNRRSVSAAFSRLMHRSDGGASYALLSFIVPTVMVAAGVLLLIVIKLLKVF